MNTQVPVGPSSVLGWVGAFAGILTTAVLSLTEHAALLSGPGKWAAILGTISLVGTGLGRQFQAAHLPQEAAIANGAGKLPDALAALAAEAQANAAKKGPDGVDGPHVAYAQADAAVAQP
jgi:hypothetical protein